MLIHKYVALNQQGEDFFVGDIHGEYGLLIQALKKCNFDFQRDRLFAVGDLIDRGPDSLACLELLTQPWFFAVRGNHEQMLFADCDSELARVHFKAGGEWYTQYSGEERFRMQSLVARLCPLALTVATSFGDIGVSHAGAPLDWLSLQHATELSRALELQCLWSLEQYQKVKQGKLFAVDNIKYTVHGHVNCSRVTTNLNQLWLDTLLRTKRLTLLSAQQIALVMA